MTETIDRIMEIAESADYLTLTEIGNRVGVSREYVRLIRRDMTIKGLWPMPWNVSRCSRCCAEIITHDKTGNTTGMGKQSRRGKYNCLECENKIESGVTRKWAWNPDRAWPKEGTLYAKVINWMESGREYNPAAMAREFAVHPGNISRAKTRIILHGLWKWDQGSGRGSGRKYSESLADTPELARYPY